MLRQVSVICVSTLGLGPSPPMQVCEVPYHARGWYNNNKKTQTSASVWKEDIL